MTLAQFTTPGLVVPHLKGTDAASAIQELCQALQREGRIPDLLPFYHTALNREFVVSTGVDAGMAFPHARLPQLRQLWYAVGRSDEPLAWGGGDAIRVVFLSAVPVEASADYLFLISGLARFSRDAVLRQSFLEADGIPAMMAILSQVPLQPHRAPTASDSSVL